MLPLRLMSERVIGWGKRMQRARMDLNLSLEEAGVRMGVTRSTLTSWEAERTSPTLDQIETIARVLSVSSAHLVFGKRAA